MMSNLPFATLPEWFENQVRATPQAIALVVDEKGEKQVTYEELNFRSNRLAHRLRELGIGPEKVVAVCLERSAELIVALLGILKAGGAYLPIDRDLPRERQAFMLADAQPSTILTQRSVAEFLPETDIPLFILEDKKIVLEETSGENVVPGLKAENLAYVMYTSGSTGMPKGVEISQRALVNFLTSMKDRPGLNSGDVLVALTTVSFDIAGLEIFLPLVVGARMIFLSREDAADGFRIIHHVERHQATILQATPSTWRMLLDAKWQGNPRLKMLCGGEGLPRELANQLLAKGGELWNMYGPTETTIWSAVSQVQPAPALISIGEPIANTELHILDGNLRPVPPGFPGELHIGGMGLARGYRNRSELTAEKFIADPFSIHPDARLYKTGDVARERAGNIEIQGRMDHQVKIRGYRIELGEIESRLLQYSEIKGAVVVARETALGNKQLIAYLVRSPGANQAMPTAGDLRAFLGQTLPEYMIPSFFEFLDAFPLTPNGKIDRKAFPSPLANKVEANRPYAAPEGPVEAKLAQIWTEILGRDRVGRNDDIFEIGGDSLLIFRIAARAHEASLSIAVRQFFQYRTIAELAAQIGKAPQHMEPSSKPLVPISRESFRRSLGKGKAQPATL